MSSQLPVYKVEGDALLSKRGDYTLPFRLHKSELFTLSAAQYETIHNAYVKGLRILPVNTILHQQDWFLKERYQEYAGDKKKSFLAESSDRFFRDRPWLRQESYLFLTRKPDNRPESTSILSSLIRGRLLPAEATDPKKIQEFRDKVSQFLQILTDTGLITVEPLTTFDLWSSQSHAGLIERYYTLSPKNNPALKDIEWKPEMRIGDEHCLLFTLADADDLPTVCSPRTDYSPFCTDRTRYSVGFAAPLGLLLDCDHIYNQYLFIDDAATVLKQLEAKRLRMQSLAAWSRANAVAEEGVNAYLNEAAEDQCPPIRAHFNIFAWTSDSAQKADIRNQIGSAITQLEASPHLETVGAPQIWYAGIPGNEGDFPANDSFRTFAEQAVCLLNHEENYRSHRTPSSIRLGDRLTGRPVDVDLSQGARQTGLIGNSNSFVLSGSGGGKSFFMNHLVREYYEQGAHILLIDVGHSYEMQCALHGGYYFTWREDEPIRFNPFYLAPDDEIDTEKRESIKNLLLALWKKASDDHNRSEYVALSAALQGYFDKLAANAHIFPCFDTFYDFLKEDFTATLAMEEVKEKDFDLGNLLYVLRPFYKDGEYGQLLNARTNLDLLHHRFIVFELDNIASHPILYPVTTLICMELFVGKMRKLKGIRKLIVVEEAWKAIAQGEMAQYIKYLFKTVRKFSGEAAVVTQELEDIVSSDVIRNAIINNADIKILLDQSKFANKFDDIQNLLGITENQKAEVLSINKGHAPGTFYKDLWIGLGGAWSKVFRLEASPEEYYVYTSDQKDKVLVKRYIDEYGDVETAIRHLVADQKAKK